MIVAGDLHVLWVRQLALLPALPTLFLRLGRQLHLLSVLAQGGTCGGEGRQAVAAATVRRVCDECSCLPEELQSALAASRALWEPAPVESAAGTSVSAVE